MNHLAIPYYYLDFFIIVDFSLISVCVREESYRDLLSQQPMALPHNLLTTGVLKNSTSVSVWSESEDLSSAKFE